MDNLTTGVPVQIHLETNILQEGQKSNFVFDVTGQLVRVGSSLYIRYEEETEDGGVPVTIKISDNGNVKLTRSGENRLQLLFSDGKRIAARYRTPIWLDGCSNRYFCFGHGNFGCTASGQHRN